MTTNHTAAPPRPAAPSCRCPASLTNLAARTVAKCLIYEDYDECNHYRWDPVNIWQYEIPHKKKKGKKASEKSQMFALYEAAVPPPKPAWQDVVKFRAWWWSTSALGSMKSVMREQVVLAFEQLSWSAKTEEEYILFLLLRICIETRLKLGRIPYDIQCEWYTDLAQILTQLGPFPLLKLCITHVSLCLEPLLISLVQQSPQLQVLQVNQWALSNTFMSALGKNCRHLTEFTIPCMRMEVFMSDEAFFECFFGGLGGEAVQKCFKEGVQPPISFPNLKVVDILCWMQTQPFIQMVAHFYPNVRLREIDVHFLNGPQGMASLFSEVRATVPALGANLRLGDTSWNSLLEFTKLAPHLRELRVHLYCLTARGDLGTMLGDAGKGLAQLAMQMPYFESLAVQLRFEDLLMGGVVPALRAKGEYVTSLYLNYDKVAIECNTLYHMVNLCPRLCVLGLASILGKNLLAQGSRTRLQPCQDLHTLVILNMGDREEPPEDPCISRVIQEVLHAAHNLKTLSLSCTTPMETTFCTLASESVRSLHLQLIDVNESPADYLTLLTHLVPNFPRLLTLSLDEGSGSFPQEALDTLLKTGVSVTKETPEFLERWKWVILTESMQCCEF